MEGPLAGDLRAAGVPVQVRPLAVVRRELLSPSGLVRLARSFGRDARALPRAGADLVHANTSVLLGGWAARVPHVVHVREIYAGWGPLWPPYRALLRRADALLCVSGAVRAALGAGTVVHDGLAAPPRVAPRAAARAALGLPADAFVAAVLGRISAWKGQEVLARALTSVPGAVGLCAGGAWPGQQHHERRLRAVAAPLGDRWRMAGFVDDPGLVLGAADVVVVPSTLPDPFPNAALEAAAGGSCVVAAAHGGLPEMLRDGVTGRLVPPGDAEALARVLRELAGDPAQRERLGRAAAADVTQRFRADRMVAAVESTYRSICARHS